MLLEKRINAIETALGLKRDLEADKRQLQIFIECYGDNENLDDLLEVSKKQGLTAVLSNLMNSQKACYEPCSIQ